MSLIDMHVPTIGESISEVTLAKWLKGNGEFVKRDEAICEFESDKATLELPAEESGKLIWEAKEGDDLAIGALVAAASLTIRILCDKVVSSPTLVALHFRNPD